MARAYDFGRVFFQYPDHILFQPLGNHVANVRKLAQQWREEDFCPLDSAASRKRVSEAARLHDMGKPQKFGVSVKLKHNKCDFQYSFRGHRFEAKAPEQPWVEMLAQGHHDFSVHDICRDTYRLKTLVNHLEERKHLKDIAKEYRNTLSINSLAYARELYILEMCDQIEADLACRCFNDDDQAETRAFMDFNIRGMGPTYEIDPWVFEESEIQLTLAYWHMPFPEEVKQAINEGKDDETKISRLLMQSVKQWWMNQPKNSVSIVSQIILKPHSVTNDKILSASDIYEARGFQPNPMQTEVAEHLEHEHPALLVQGPTGSGKTETILYPALAQNRRLFLILPARSLLEDQRDRIDQVFKDFSALPANENREFSMVIDTGSQMERRVYLNGKEKNLKVKNPRRHLYKGNVILTTLDKFLYRYFSYGEKQKNYIFPHHIQQENCLFCFDEAHSYDSIAFTNFQSLVRSLYEAGRDIVLMTATMPSSLLESFDYLNTIDYVHDSERSQQLQNFFHQTAKRPYLNQYLFSWICEANDTQGNSGDFQESCVKEIEGELTQNPSRRILVVVQTVKDAVAIYQSVKQKLGGLAKQQSLHLYHGRLSDQQRVKVYRTIQELDRNSNPYIVVTTSAIEVGCDLNAETLITQICPPENLIQRAGRCNRKGDVADAKIILVGDEIPEFANSLDEEAWIAYKVCLESLKQFDAGKIRACIQKDLHVDDYRIVELFSILHDYVYQADLTCQPAHEKGLVVTRSWTPSVTLVFDNGGQGDWVENLHRLPKTTVPIDRLLLKKDNVNAFASVDVYERLYNQENSRWEMKPLRWGVAYQKDIYVRIAQSSDGILHEFQPPYQYSDDIGFAELPGLFIRLPVNDYEQKLLYKPNRDQAQKAIIRYVSNTLEN